MNTDNESCPYLIVVLVHHQHRIVKELHSCHLVRLHLLNTETESEKELETDTADNLELSSYLVQSASNNKAPSDLASCSTESPRQPAIKFPRRVFGNCRKRGFNIEWYNCFPWLEYSIERDTAYCYPCRLFTAKQHHSKDSNFTANGFHNWKNAMGTKGILKGHNTCSAHKESVIIWKQNTLNTRKD